MKDKVILWCVCARECMHACLRVCVGVFVCCWVVVG